MSTSAFDPVTFKATTRRQWEAAAEAWDRWNPTLDAWLGPVTDRMLDLCGISPGARVLDIAAGAGGQTLAAARRVGPHGHVLATDLSPTILEYAGQRARDAGLDNVTVSEADGEDLGVPDGSFDAVICRLGLMYFPDQPRALAGMRTALRPGGRIGAIVYGPADRNGFFSVPVGIVRRHAQLPPPAPGQPGPFGLGAPGVLGDALTRAGFRDVVIEAVDAPLRMDSAADCLRFAQESFGALHQMLADLDDSGRAAAWDEVGTALAGFEGPDGFTGPCQILVAAATR
ncbi:methyltransferase domain-containing protein [Longispora sp. K20-0274]|uniref:class I SAM-dependent methyltransferase n=1 Tax=Longispora sp. K20-0274 TaxID=3088255 RepID=UPI00399A28B2